MPYFFSQNLQTNLGQQANFGAIIVVWPNQPDKSALVPIVASPTLAAQTPIVVQNNFTPSIAQTPAEVAPSVSTLTVANLGIEASGEDIPILISLSEL